MSFGFKINIYMYELFEMCLWHQNLEALEFAALVSIKIENVFLTLKKKKKAHKTTCAENMHFELRECVFMYVSVCTIYI